MPSGRFGTSARSKCAAAEQGFQQRDIIRSREPKGARVDHHAPSSSASTNRHPERRQHQHACDASDKHASELLWSAEELE